MKIHHFCLILLTLSSSSALSQVEIPSDKIESATVNLHTTYAIGWQYRGNTWTKGSPEEGEVGKVGTQDGTGVRAVCLGREKVGDQDYFVFFCLRSFIDPFYPSPVIQEVKQTPPLSSGNQKIELTSLMKASTASEDSDESRLGKVVRYGRLDFTWYESQGGGLQTIKSKLPVTVFSDPDDVKVIGALGFGRHPKENFRGGTYPRPQENFSVEQHFNMQLDEQNGCDAKLRFYEDHDVVLIYVPQCCFETHDQKSPPHLGIDRPTLAVDLLLHRTQNLFGFKFVLFGQETLDQVKRYQPEDYDLSGFEKLAGFVGFAMSPATLGMIYSIDAALDAILPSPVGFDELADLWGYYETIKPDQLGTIGVALVTQWVASQVK